MGDDHQVFNLLSSIQLPGMSLTAADIASIDLPTITLSLGCPTFTLGPVIRDVVVTALKEKGIEAEVEIQQNIPKSAAHNTDAQVKGVKNIIAVASGKGGVGKSTVSVNLALALAYEGARVGILDADIYGPSQPHMLGLGDKRPDVIENRLIKPLQAHGISVVSMGSLVTENTPMVWRGPMVSGALKQLLTQTQWPDIDYLIVDMPPGTGDIQLTLSQSVPVSSAVIVTTPQDIALLDAKKGIEMFQKVHVPVAGVVENMAMHVCSNCGHEEAIFGEHGGDKLAEEYATHVLGRLPLRKDIRESVDAGKPPVAADPESSVSQAYRDIAMAVAVDLWLQSENEEMPEIVISDD